MVFTFTIDKWLGPYVPGSFLHKFPAPVRRVLGDHTARPHPDYLIWLETFVGTMGGVLLLEGVFKSNTVFKHHHSPVIIASYGALAILVFNASQVPLAQPRNVFFGMFVSSLIGVCIQKLFLMGAREYLWIGGALSVAISSVLMSVLNCIHPPAGASALLPLIEGQIIEMGWWYLPAQIVSSVLIISVGCITGNVFRRYPVFWWTAAGLAPKTPPVPKIEISADNLVVPPAVAHLVDTELLQKLQEQLRNGD